MKVLDITGAGSLVKKLLGKLPVRVTQDKEGLCPPLPNDDAKYLNGIGEWAEVSNSGLAGAFLFQIENGDLYVLYEEGTTPPSYEIDDKGDLYAIFDDGAEG